MYKALGEIYVGLINEEWNNLPTGRGGTSTPTQSQSSLAYKGSFNVDRGDLGDQAMGNSNQMTFAGEQEEGIGGSINKDKLFQIIDKLSSSLDGSKITDRTALLVLGKLKKSIS